MANPLRELEKLGQSVWIDFLGRGALDNGDLLHLIEEDGVSGLTSNPTIFERSILKTSDYDTAIRSLAKAGKSAKEIYQALTVEDIQRAADLFRPIYERTGGADGYVSLELTSTLARDTAGSIREARVLWAAVSRPNLFIKVPGTREGLPVIRELISAGINVNITLLFGLQRYRDVTDAYLTGLENLMVNANRPVDRMASVASFFLSRIDTMVDPLLEKIQQENGPKAELAGRLRGQAAIASAKLAYQIYKDILASQRWQKLADQGAHPQRLLWASTSTKNKAYSDVKYVEPLIGPDTINTMPLETLELYRDHGQPASRLEQGVPEARGVMDGLRQAGIDLDQITQRLEEEGVAKFNESTEGVNAGLEKKRAALVASSQQVRS